MPRRAPAGRDGQIIIGAVEIPVFLFEHPIRLVFGTPVEIVPEVVLPHVPVDMGVIIPRREIQFPMQVVHVDGGMDANGIVGDD